MMLKDTLENSGFSVIGTPNSLEEAAGFLATCAFDIAILDVHIGGELVFPVAERIRDAGVPVMFSSGSIVESLPDAFAGAPLLMKPYGEASVLAAVRAALRVPAHA